MIHGMCEEISRGYVLRRGVDRSDTGWEENHLFYGNQRIWIERVVPGGHEGNATGECDACRMGGRGAVCRRVYFARERKVSSGRNYCRALQEVPTSLGLLIGKMGRGGESDFVLALGAMLRRRLLFNGRRDDRRFQVILPIEENLDPHEVAQLVHAECMKLPGVTKVKVTGYLVVDGAMGCVGDFYSIFLLPPLWE